MLEILDVYQRHFRKLGEQIEFEDSFILWELTQLIKHIAILVEKLISSPVRPNHGDEDELVKKLQWNISFFWVAFDKKKNIHQARADEACEVLVYIGLLFFDHLYPDMLKSSVSHIKSIMKSYCKTVDTPNEYDLGDFYAHLWCLRRLTDARGNTTQTQLIDEVLDTKPETLNAEQWQHAQGAIELRRQQLDERLGERYEGDWRDSSVALLQRLLGKNTSDEADDNPE